MGRSRATIHTKFPSMKFRILQILIIIKYFPIISVFYYHYYSSEMAPFFISIIGLMCGAVCIVYYQAALALRGAAAHRASLDLLVIE